MAEFDSPTIPQEDEQSILERKISNSTFVQIHRSFHEGYLRGDASTQAVLLFLICKAQRFEKESGGKTYKPGEVIASRKLIEDVTGLSKRVIFRCLNKLEKAKTVVTRRDRRGTYITICNYRQYQLIDKHVGSTDVPRLVPPLVPPTVPITIRKEGKKEKKKEFNKGGGIHLTPPQNEIWLSYSESFRENYEVDPILNFKQQNHLQTLHELIGDDAAGLVAFYCAVKRPYYIERRHTLDLCIQDAEKLHTAFMQSRGIGYSHDT